jgi:uncharacterized protein
LALAESLMITCLDEFYDKNDQFFNFSSKVGENLIANKKELFDNVIPSSNSMMAHNLFDLGVLLSRTDFYDLSKIMVQKMMPLVLKNGEYLSNWALLAQKQLNSKIEIVIYGAKCKEFKIELLQEKLPNYFILGTEKQSNLPLFLDRKPPENQTYIYVCIDNACHLPVQSVEQAVITIRNNTE